MAGLRERKKEQTRRRIAEAAWRLFVERGFEAVTVSEIAEAAEVAKATLFAYFPTKESLALEGVGDDDLAGIVARRPARQSALAALREHYRAFAAGPMTGLDTELLVSRIRVVFESPTLSSAANALLYQQRQRLAETLTAERAERGEQDERAEQDEQGERAEPGERAAVLMAAQISASLVSLQEAFFQQLAAGASLEEARRQLGEDVELAFDLLTHGLDRIDGPAETSRTAHGPGAPRADHTDRTDHEQPKDQKGQ